LLYLTTPSTETVRAAMRAGWLGAMLGPKDWKAAARLADITVAIDNGCFADAWAEAPWLDALDRYVELAPLFATAPDVVGDAAATLERSRPWLRVIAARGIPVAFVGQDGIELERVPWDDFDVFFIGGTTDWKMSPQAFGAAVEARRRGKHCHLGRVNSLRRLRNAVPFFDTCDGTFIKFAPDTNLPRIRRWLDALEAAPQMEFGL
jgi:hypothetical protein